MKKILLILAGCAALTNARTQDFHLSMYDAGPLFLNPAMTGVLEGDWRVHGQFRTQWKAVNFKPYTTALISFDAPVKKWGFGVQIANARAGIGNYNALQGLLSVGYTVPLTKNKAHNLSFGVQGGVTQKSVEYKLYTFNNQYVSSNGGSFDPGLSSNENFASSKIMLPVVNAGVLYYYAKQQSKINPFLGISAFNLLEPTESFFNSNNKLPMRFYAHTGVRLNLTETIYLLPKLLIMQQANASEQTFACDAGFFFKQSEMYLIAGLIYRSVDAGILSVGAKKNNYVARVSYDFNMSTLTPTSSGRGGFELSFTYIKQKEKAREKKICPRL